MARADCLHDAMYQPTPQVLLVEPDMARQAALAAWLEGAGYDCVPVSDPDEALAIAEDDEADVALVSSPVASWSAPHLAVALQSRDANLPVIVVRGSGEARQGPLRSRVALEEIPAPLTRGAVMRAVLRALEWRDASPDERRRYLEIEHAIIAQATLVCEACLAEPCSADALVDGLVRFLDRRVPGAGAHAARVAAVAGRIGLALNLPGDRLATVAHAAALHDLGLALLPQSLRQPTGALGRLERAIVSRHPQMVFDLLARVSGLQKAARLVVCAHERFDGSGFPSGLSGMEIPLDARVVALANAIDVAGHAQPLHHDEAAVGSDLVRRAGSELDPDLVRVWLRLADHVGTATLH